MSYLTQMGGLAVQNFLSAAVGLAVAIAMIRGFTRSRTALCQEFTDAKGNPLPQYFQPRPSVRELVTTYTQGLVLGFLGEPSVNVLNLNIALDRLSAKSGSGLSCSSAIRTSG